jgi:sortase A
MGGFMRKLGYFLMALGLGILIYLGINQYLVYREQNALISTIDKISTQYEPTEETSGDQGNSTEGNVPEKENPKRTAIGILEIPSIKLSVAIVEGTKQKDLRTAIGHVEGTGELGKENNNFALAGHRSHTAGRFFNKLDKVKENDLLHIQSGDKKYTYRVFKSEVVLPEQVEVLEPQKGRSLVTLVTCTPVYNPTHRLIVYAELVKE